jgi:hypothetical protein
MNLNLLTEPYHIQSPCWPNSGRHILAQYDDETIIVYQAFRAEIAAYAINHGRFGGEFSFTRMSWIKPNFLWMMYRSAWGTKPGQEATLGIRLSRTFFDSLLAQAVESSFRENQFSSYEEWSRAIKKSNVRLQWDPDHDPHGTDLSRRAIQLGLRRKALIDYGKKEILEVIDLTAFVGEQRKNLTHAHIDELLTPLERVYRPGDPDIGTRLELDPNS